MNVEIVNFYPGSFIRSICFTDKFNSLRVVYKAITNTPTTTTTTTKFFECGISSILKRDENFCLFFFSLVSLSWCSLNILAHPKSNYIYLCNLLSYQIVVHTSYYFYTLYRLLIAVESFSSPFFLRSETKKQKNKFEFKWFSHPFWDTFFLCRILSCCAYIDIIFFEIPTEAHTWKLILPSWWCTQHIRIHTIDGIHNNNKIPNISEAKRESTHVHSTQTARHRATYAWCKSTQHETESRV